MPNCSCDSLLSRCLQYKYIQVLFTPTYPSKQELNFQAKMSFGTVAILLYYILLDKHPCSFNRFYRWTFEKCDQTDIFLLYFQRSRDLWWPSTLDRTLPLFCSFCSCLNDAILSISPSRLRFISVDLVHSCLSNVLALVLLSSFRICISIIIIAGCRLTPIDDLSN